MSNTTHTPGPWEVWKGHYSVYAVGPNTENERGWITGARRPICEMQEDEFYDEVADYAEMGVNARLIAAAPDLLAVLREILTRVGAPQYHTLDYCYCALCGRELRDEQPCRDTKCPGFAARAAIAKATGGME
jgi:hypothetical protein